MCLFVEHVSGKLNREEDVSILARNVSGEDFDNFTDIAGARLIYENQIIYYTERVLKPHEQIKEALADLVH